EAFAAVVADGAVEDDDIVHDLPVRRCRRAGPDGDGRALHHEQIGAGGVAGLAAIAAGTALGPVVFEKGIAGDRQGAAVPHEDGAAEAGSALAVEAIAIAALAAAEAALAAEAAIAVGRRDAVALRSAPA